MTVEKESILARADKGIPVTPYAVDMMFISNVEETEFAWLIHEEASDRVMYISKVLSPEGFTPEVGQQARVISHGSEICGADIRDSNADDWRELFYLDQATRKERLEERRAAQDAEAQEIYEAEREDLERRVAELPDIYQRRIERLRANNDSFDRDYLGYELFGLEEARKIAAALRDELPEGATQEQILEAMQDFYEKPVAIQSARYGISDAHSPDSFGFAVSVAGAEVAGNEDFLVEQHGALASKVGCLAYGCHTQEDMDRVKAAQSQTEEVIAP